MHKRALFFVLATLLAGVPALAGGKDEQSGGSMHLVVATDPTFPPMEFVDKDGAIVGLEVDLMRAAAEAGGFTFEFRSTTWDHIFAGLASGRYEAIMSSVTITEDRKKSFDFSIPYLTMAQVLVVNSDRSCAETLDDLSGQVVGVLSGSASAEEISGLKDGYELTVKTYSDSVPLVTDLAAGRIVAIVIDQVQARIVESDPYYSGALKIIGEPLAEEHYGVVVRKNDEIVLDSINKGLKAVLSTDAYAKILEKWSR
jgi:polar amino acid transport system substrate-binding protein